MPSAVSIAGEVSGAAAALAGLILVFLGATATSYDAYRKEEQRSVRKRYQRRAWLSFSGFLFALISTTAALLGKWLGSEWAAGAALVVLCLALIVVLVAAFLAVWEIK
jgi:ABC-type transport system involved in cytochrome bd biosynthesis fused ATPase/permease subunit